MVKKRKLVPLVAPSKKKAPPKEEADEEEQEHVAVVRPTTELASTLEEAVYSQEADSCVRARRVFRSLVAPVSARSFYDKYFERRALWITGRPPTYLDGWITSDDVWRVLDGMQHGVDVDVTRYDGTRKDLGKGECSASFARRAFEKGASVRLRTPQERLPAVHALCEALEDEFGASVSANAYLTPAKTQGFAPHWDDVDVFVLQVEGTKRWKVYQGDRLPRVSSQDLEKVDKPILDAVLRKGDLLYLPRGFAHEAKSLGEDSLHLTVSTHRQNTWADLLEHLVTRAVNETAADDASLREAIPRDTLHLLGIQHAAEDDDGHELSDIDELSEVTAAALDPELPRGRERRGRLRSDLKRAIHTRLDVVVDKIMDHVDGAADDLALRFLQERQPPRQEPKKHTISHATLLRPAGRRLARLVVEGSQALVYHAVQNARGHYKRPLSCLEFELSDAPAIEALLDAHPARPVAVHQLPLPSLDDRLSLASALVKEGVVVPAKDD